MILMMAFSLNTSAVNSMEGDSDILVYPNPAIDFLRIEYLGESTSVPIISIHNLIGQVVLSLDDQPLDPSGCYIVEITDLPSGIYVLRVDFGESSSVQRITKR